MNKSTQRRSATLCGIIFSLVIIFVCYSGFFTTPIAATSANQAISSTLSDFNATDAVYVETLEGEDCSILVYHSDSTGYDYCFRESTGILTAITNIGNDELESSATVYSRPLSDEKRLEIVMDFVYGVYQDTIIGQLEVTEVHDAGYAYYYSIEEYYNGMETGTEAFVSCYDNGKISVCNVTFGSIFKRNMDGSISLLDESPFIGEEAAIDIALDEVESHAAQRGCTLLPETAVTTIRASENLQYYEVSVDTQQADGYVVGYIVCVDVHSGEITLFVFDQ